MSRSGKYHKNLSGEMSYLSFMPNPLPPKPEIEYDETMAALLVKSNNAVAKLNAISTRLPSVPLFVSMYVRKEALLSSQIEGTQATIDDILDPNIEHNINQNITDVLNYIKAADFATARLTELPICNRLLLETHKVLLEDVRGSEKNPGEFRRSQNWIGAQGSSLKTARYIPPNVEDMENAMSDLEKYINAVDTTDTLIRIALIHYQFETIHPFLDGNGRIGRLMINLFLSQEGLLRLPTLYISYFLKRNRIEYYDRLTDVREKGSFEGWVKFFLQGIYESAEDAIESIDKITALYEKNKAVVSKNDKTKSNSMERIFEYLQHSPIIDTRKTAEHLKLSYNTAAAAIKNLETLSILQQSSSGQRNKTYSYEDYLAILRKDT